MFFCTLDHCCLQAEPHRLADESGRELTGSSRAGEKSFKKETSMYKKNGFAYGENRKVPAHVPWPLRADMTVRGCCTHATPCFDFKFEPFFASLKTTFNIFQACKQTLKAYQNYIIWSVASNSSVFGNFCLLEPAPRERHFCDEFSKDWKRRERLFALGV